MLKSCKISPLSIIPGPISRLPTNIRTTEYLESGRHWAPALGPEFGSFPLTKVRNRHRRCTGPVVRRASFAAPALPQCFPFAAMRIRSNRNCEAFHAARKTLVSESATVPTHAVGALPIVKSAPPLNHLKKTGGGAFFSRKLDRPSPQLPKIRSFGRAPGALYCFPDLKN